VVNVALADCSLSPCEVMVTVAVLVSPSASVIV